MVAREEPTERTPLLAPEAIDPDQAWPEENGKVVPKGVFKLSSRDKIGLVAAVLGILLAAADTSLVWATHETVASRFNELRNASWMMTSFTIGYCVTLPLYGQLSDTYGRLRPLITSYSLFCLGCTISGLGQNFWQVIIGRVIAGFGASGMTSLASIIITDLAPPSEVAILRSYVNVAAVVGISLGGPIGGLITGSAGWRWSFLCQVPVAVFCCVLIYWSLHDSVISGSSPSPECTERDCDLPDCFSIGNFDFPGALSLASAVTSLLVVIDLKRTQLWTQAPVLCTILIGSSSVLVFILSEMYTGRRKPLIPLWLLKTEVGIFCLAQLLILGGRHAFVSHIAPYFSRTQDLSDAAAGSYIIPTSIGNALGALVAGQAIKSLGGYKKLSLVSLFLSIAVSILILMTWSHAIGYFEAAAATFLAGFFTGIISSTQFIGLSTTAPKEYMATAIGMYYMSQQIGIAMGISIGSGLLQMRFKNTLEASLVDIEGIKDIIKNVLSDASFTHSLPVTLKLRIEQCYLGSFWVIGAIYTMTHILTIAPMITTTDVHWY